MTNNKQASINKRIAAMGIDMVPACIIQAILMFIYIILPIMSEKTSSVVIDNRIITITLIASVILVIKDSLKGQSIGKRVLKLQVISANGENVNASIGALILRNIFIIIWPVELLLMIAGQERIGDRIAKTKVMDCVA